MEKKVLVDLDKMGEIKDTYEYVKEDKTELQRLDGVLKSLSADGLVRCDLVLTNNTHILANLISSLSLICQT